MLPKDERKTLLKYHKHIRNIDESIRFTNLSERVYNSTRNLIERKLIHEIKQGGQEHSSYMTTYMAGDPVSLEGFLSSSEEDETRQAVVLNFTLKGLDLARRYSTRLGTAWIWCNEYKLWVILGAIIGLAGLIVSILVAILKE